MSSSRREGGRGREEEAKVGGAEQPVRARPIGSPGPPGPAPFVTLRGEVTHT